MPSILQARKFIAMGHDFLERDRLDEAGDMYIAAGRELQRCARPNWKEPTREAAAGSGSFAMRPPRALRIAIMPRVEPDDGSRADALFDTSDVEGRSL
jgi:hypothetical protein